MNIIRGVKSSSGSPSSSSPSFNHVVNVHQMIIKLKKNIQHSNGLTTNELLEARSNFNSLLRHNEDAVHYKVLSRDMLRLRIFPDIESGLRFCQRVLPELITFDDLIKISRCDDFSVRDLIKGYLRLLAEECASENHPRIALPHIQTHKPTDTNPSSSTKLFSHQIYGSESRLSLIPRQKQIIVRQDSDLKNPSLPAFSPKSHKKSDSPNSIADSGTTEIPVSLRIKYGLIRADSGYSYRRDEGARCKKADLKVVSPKSDPSLYES